MATQTPAGLLQWDMRDVHELRELFPGAQFTSIGSEPFRAKAVRRVLTDVTIEGIASTPYLVQRLPSDIEAAPSNDLYLHVILEGRGEVERGPAHFTVTPCDVFLLRPGQPFAFRCPVWTRTFRASVPETVLPLDLRGRYSPPFAVLPASAVTRAFLRLAQDLLLNEATLGPRHTSRSHLEAALVALEQGAVAEALAHWPTRSDSKAGLRAAVLDYIEGHFRDRSLSPASIAAEFSVSVRTVHNLFVALPETAAEHIRRRRIEEATAVLRGRDATATELAGSLGFTSRDTFIRAFQQQQQGMSPSEYRSLRADLIEPDSHS